MVPSPCTGGGGKTAMNASWSAANLRCSVAAISGPDSPLPLRSSNGLRPTKMMPELGLLLRPAIDNPGKAMACSTPSVSSAILPMRRMTSSVRSSEAASGSCAKLTRYCLSCVGTKPPGTCAKPT